MNKQYSEDLKKRFEEELEKSTHDYYVRPTNNPLAYRPVKFSEVMEQSFNDIFGERE